MGIMMEHCGHGSLFTYLHERPDHSTPDLEFFSPLRIARDIARAMQYLQNRDKPVLYRDLKSKNVLIDERLSVKLAYAHPHTAHACNIDFCVSVCAAILV